MGTKAVPAPMHVFLNFSLNPSTDELDYESPGRDGKHLVLHHRETVTFRSHHRFTMRFLEESPFWPSREDTILEPNQCDGRWEWTSCVRDDAYCKRYPYLVELTKEGRLSVGVPKGVTIMEDPEVIIVESGAY